MVTATGALEDYWTDAELQKQTLAKGRLVERALNEIALEHAGAVDSVRGRGLVWGLVMRSPELAPKVCAEAFERGLLMETSGPEGEVVKLLPPLTTTEAELTAGLEILADSVRAVRTAVAA